MIVWKKTDIVDLLDHFNSNGWSLYACLEVNNFCFIGFVDQMLYGIFILFILFIIRVLKSFVVLHDDRLGCFDIVFTLSIFVQEVVQVIDFSVVVLFYLSNI